MTIPPMEDSCAYLEVSSLEAAAAPTPQEKWRGRAVLALGVAGVLLVVGLAASTPYDRTLAWASKPVVSLAQVRGATQGECAGAGSDCRGSRCCQDTGYSCFEVSAGRNRCMARCLPGVDGTCIGQAAAAPAGEAPAPAPLRREPAITS
eukprot:CAMPEP_0179276178 /NCGR_PEP_ID=MMETSP0797-20121207/34442_1 /TAXON_ID=47934 /ORGANISM="Dinophysis acuminata, Strain DAEP01" /LENGTH=148 /DNA_ID=CAMNT_0020984723 /DNA_START=9 /DNA_END=455 /DNA_ORIENTATION=+